MLNSVFLLVLVLAALMAASFVFARRKAKATVVAAGEGAGLIFHSQPGYYGWLAGIVSGLAALMALVAGANLSLNPWMTLTLMMVVGLAGSYFAASRVSAEFRARTYVEFFIKTLLVTCSLIAVFTTVGIILSLVFESFRFFQEVSFLDFLTGLQWSPQTAMRSDQVGQSGAFGAIPVFTGTFLIMAIAIVVAAPIGLLIAIYLSEYAEKRTRKIVKPVIEILAGVPTVVYGFFALMTVGPAIRALAETMGFSVPTQSAITAGLVMGIMIIPFVSSLSDDVINAVPQSMRDGSYALGATKSETMTKVVFAGALPGIIGALLLAVSRAIGETMIVVLAAGRAANLTGNPFEAVTTVTVQIVALLTGDQEFDSAKTLAAFALGLMLFIITLVLNFIALIIVRRYRARYE
ncbi:MAG: phosphate ABC transporter permease subunit PstC [Hellea sp.]|nr:phosphate ABC transporter permease subunit PstC [Hellea sp.]